MGDPGPYQELEQRLLESLGLEGQRVTSLSINFAVGSVPLVNVSMYLDPDEGAEEFVELFKEYTLERTIRPFGGSGPPHHPVPPGLGGVAFGSPTTKITSTTSTTSVMSGPPVSSPSPSYLLGAEGEDDDDAADDEDDRNGAVYTVPLRSKTGPPGYKTRLGRAPIISIAPTAGTIRFAPPGSVVFDPVSNSFGVVTTEGSVEVTVDLATTDPDDLSMLTSMYRLGQAE